MEGQNTIQNPSLALALASQSIPPAGLIALQQAGNSTAIPAIAVDTLENGDRIRTQQDRALKNFRDSLVPEEQMRIGAGSSLGDVIKEAKDVLDRAKKSRSKASKRVEAVLRALDNFAIVGDIMCQFDGSIASLAWGGFRLVLKMATRNYDVLELIVDFLERIFLLLGRTELYSSLFSLHRLQEGIVTLYMHILDFLSRAVRFLRKSAVMRFTSSFFQPWKLELEQSCTKIREYVDDVEKEANLAHMVTMRRQNEELQHKVDGLRTALATQTVSINNMACMMSNLCFHQRAERQMFVDLRTGECRVLARKLTKYISAIDYMDNVPGVLAVTRKYLPAEACAWIADHPLFQRWKDQDAPNVLALMGGRSTGKFVLSSYVTHLLLDDPNISSRTIWFHTVLWEREPLTAELVLRCFIAQLLRMRPDVLTNRPSAFYKRRFKSAKGLRELFTLFADIVAVVGRTYILVDGLDSCPDNALLVGNLLSLAESQLPLKIILTAIDDPNMGPALESVAKINLTPDSVSCDIAPYVRSQLRSNFGHLDQSQLDDSLVNAIITGAAGNLGWAHYILWDLAHAKDDAGIERMRLIALKGVNVEYARQFDAVARAVDSRYLCLIKLILRVLLSQQPGEALAISEIEEGIAQRNEVGLDVLLNTFDKTAWGRVAIEKAIAALLARKPCFLSVSERSRSDSSGGGDCDGKDAPRYAIASVQIREYFFEHIPSQRPFIPHLWLPSDTCVLRCQLSHFSGRRQNGIDGDSVEQEEEQAHVPADFSAFISNPGSSHR